MKNNIAPEGKYFVIVNPNSKYVSFSKTNHDICFGTMVENIIPEYTNQQYADDYGDTLTNTKHLSGYDSTTNKPIYEGEFMTIREYMKINCSIQIN